MTLGFINRTQVINELSYKGELIANRSLLLYTPVTHHAIKVKT